VIGAGDTLELNLFGKESSQHTLTVDNEGKIIIPGLEPITVSGLTYSELKSFIADTVKTKMIGIKSALTISDLRSIQVYVVGDVTKPGAYSLSSLSTLTNALFISGGPNLSGSLRNIQLKRGGKKVASFDLYDLLIRGDVSNDLRLQQGDVVFVGGIENQVTILGEVRKPAIFEVKTGETIRDLVSMAGGLTTKAYPKHALLARLDENFQRDLKRINLTNAKTATQALKNGDVLTIMPISERLDQVVNVAGAVSRPSTYAWYEGITLSELIDSKDDLKNTTDMSYALILSHMPNGSYSIRQFKPSTLFMGNDVILTENDLVVFFNRFDTSTFELFNEFEQLDSDKQKQLKSQTAESFLQNDEPELSYLYALQNGDIFEKQEALLATQSLSRQELIKPIVKLLYSTSMPGALVQVVEVTGQVRFPGIYPIGQGSRVNDLILAAGGLEESANLFKGEISRIDSQGSASSIQHIEFSLKDAIDQNETQNHELQARDVVNIFQQANWKEELRVTIEGEVLYPGEYTIKEGESLSQVLQRAGGLTKFAAPEGAFFTRKALKDLEEKQARSMARSLSKELAFKSISSSYANINVGEVQQLVNNLTTVQGVGRLVIDLPMILSGESNDVKMENGDAIIIPAFRNEVNVIGEVQVATSHLHQDKWKLEQYLKSSGGLRLQADDERIYVIRANGLVDAPDRSWFGDENLEINPGDTIVVPLDSGYTDRLTLWEKATAIFYQLTVGLAALGRL
jgi:protein involved in polysaccharide export with SLBB domain